MAKKCELCKDKIETIFLEKIRGTHVNISGKKKLVCSKCQKKHKHVKDELL